MIRTLAGPPVANQHYEVLLELAECYAALADTRAASDCYHQAMALAPDQAQPHVGLGTVAVEAQQWEQAEAEFTQAVRLEPDSAEGYGGLALVRQHRQDYAAAFDMYLRCLDRDSDNLVALLGLFQTSRQMGNFSKIVQYLELYLQRHPDDASVLFCLGSLYARDGQFQDARRTLRRVLELEPGKPEAMEMLVEVEQRLSRPQT
jgi:tetratricopeptide (TPR) repeat protein